MLAQLTRHFKPDPEYWLNTCTLRDWTEIWARELTETPPLEVWAAVDHQYNPPGSAPAAPADDESGEWTSGLPDVTE